MRVVRVMVWSGEGDGVCGDGVCVVRVCEGDGVSGEGDGV